MPAKLLQIYHAFLMHGPALSIYLYAAAAQQTLSGFNRFLKKVLNKFESLFDCAALQLLGSGFEFSEILTLFKSFATEGLKWHESYECFYLVFSLCSEVWLAEFPEAVLQSVWFVRYLKQCFTAYFDHFSYPEGEPFHSLACNACISSSGGISISKYIRARIIAFFAFYRSCSYSTCLHRLSSQ